MTKREYKKVINRIINTGFINPDEIRTADAGYILELLVDTAAADAPTPTDADRDRLATAALEVINDYR